MEKSWFKCSTISARHRPGLTQIQKRTPLTSCDLTEFFEFQCESISISANFHLYLTQIAKISEISVVLQFTKLNSWETRKFCQMKVVKLDTGQILSSDLKSRHLCYKRSDLAVHNCFFDLTIFFDNFS